MSAMPEQTIAVGADHAGVDLKDALKRHLEARGFRVLDFGTDGPASVDYPDFAHAVARAVESGAAGRGVLVCGSGIGISMAANRHAGIRAAPCHDVTTARLSRQHNDANIIALGARLTPPAAAIECLETFLATDYEGGRHDRRLAKLTPAAHDQPQHERVQG
jgi:ribose 5-phosphate isomerase B